MDNSPLVSIVIPSYNYDRFLGEAIESALRQTHAPVEVVVVDDGSTDGSRAVISSFGARIKTVLQDNLGLPSARNSGIREAGGEYLLFLDADDGLLPGAAADLLEGFALRPEAGIVFGDAVWMDEKGREIGRHGSGPECVSYRDMLRGNPILVSEALVRRSILTQTGLFDPGLRQCEDYDLWLRASRLFPIIHLGRTVTRIRRHPQQLSQDRARQLMWELRVKESLTDPSVEMRRALGNLHHRLAYEYRRLGDRRNWRRHALQAIRFTPAFWKNWVYLLLSFFG
jgi:glycosyltransferase involved in cell wall biosynthesis